MGLTPLGCIPRASPSCPVEVAVSLMHIHCHSATVCDAGLCQKHAAAVTAVRSLWSGYVSPPAPSDLSVRDYFPNR